VVGRARTRSSTALAAGVCAVLTVLTACGNDPDEGTNGVGRLSPSKIELKAREAAQRADAVRLSGNVVSKGQTYRLHLHLKRNGGVGEVSANGGHTFSLLRVGKDLYLKADADFWARQERGGKRPSSSDVRAAGKLNGKYVKVPSGDPAYRQFSGFTDMDVLLGGLLTLGGKRERGDYGKVGSARTIRVRAGGGSGGTVDVSLNGTPYPLRLKRGGGAGTLELSGWDQTFGLRAPGKSQVVDYGRRIFSGRS
jgi:hypothetical protein